MYRADFNKCYLGQTVQPRCSYALKSTAYDTDGHVSLSSFLLFCNAWDWDYTYSAVMCFELAQPKENPEKMTQERTKMFFRPYMSLIFEMQTANPTKVG